MADIESLELQITSDAKGAKDGLDALITTLDTLKTKTNGGCGLSAIAKPLGKITAEAGKLNGSEGAKLESLAKGLSALSTLGQLKISSSIANQISAMAEATKKLDGVDTGKLGDLGAAVQPLTELGKSNLGSVLNAVKKLPEVASELNKVDLATFGTQVRQLATDLKPLADEMQKLGNGFSVLPGEIQTYLNANSKVPASNKASTMSFKEMATKVVAIVYAFKRAVRAIASWINESNEYTENLNLFTVAMGEYAAEAQKYAEHVGEVMGIDPSDWMRSQGVFMTLATGFGVAGDRAAVMSQQLTQLGYDLSSFFNISVEEAMDKLKSGFSGELEPLRNLGYDLSQAKLEAVALSLGIKKSVNSMTQAEKAQLRYYAIMTQVTTVQGDMARTLENPANQLRILRAQVTQAARALGNIFIPILNAVLPYVIAAAKVIRILANSIASLFGFQLQEIDYSSLGGASAGAGEISDSLDEASDSAAKLKKTLLGIDELNVMPDASSGGSDTSGIGGGGFDFELPTYDFIGEATESRVNQIVEDMKEWLGITDDITSWAELMDTKFGSILKTVGAVGIAFGTWKIGTGIARVIEWFKNSKLIAFFGQLGTAIAGLVTGTMTFGEAVTSVFAGANGIIGGFMLVVGGLIGYISNLISMLREGESVTNVLGAALGGLATAAGGFLIAIGVGASVATGGIVALVIAGVAAVGMLVAVIINHWEEIKSAIASAYSWFRTTILSPLVAFFSGVATWFYSNVISPIVSFFAPIFQMLFDGMQLIYTRSKEIVMGVITAIGSILTKTWEIFAKIVEIAIALGQAFNTYVIQPLISAIGSFATLVYNKVVKPIVNFFVDVGSWVYKAIINPILDAVVWLRDKAITISKAIGTTVVNFISATFKSVINGVLYAIESSINSFIRLLNGAITIINKIPGVSITRVSLLSIPRLAEGGVVNAGQMFVANEAGPELVGNVGRKTAVMNNDQIVDSVSRGVYQAVVAAMGSSNGDQVVEAKVNDKVLFEVMVSRARQETMRTGYNPLLGGV